MSNKKTLTEAIIKNSTATIWEDAKREWSLYKIFYAYAHCVCGHNIFENCIIKNKINDKELIVGNECIRHFDVYGCLQIDDSVYDALKCIRNDVYNNYANKALLDMAVKMNIFSSADRTYYLEITTGKNCRSRFDKFHEEYDARAYNGRYEENMKLLMGFSQSRPKCHCGLLAIPKKDTKTFFYGCPLERESCCKYTSFPLIAEFLSPPPVVVPATRSLKRRRYNNSSDSFPEYLDDESLISSEENDDDEPSNEKEAVQPNSNNNTVPSTPSEADEILAKIADSIDIIDSAFRLYNPKELAVALSVGKDSIVMNHLIETAFKLLPYWKVTVDLVSNPNSAVMSSTITDKNHITLRATTVKDGLWKLKERSIDLDIRAIFIGQRQTDLAAQTLPVFQPTDSNWPAFMRINPIAHWSYKNIWRYIDMHNLPYPKEYEQGYSSLGLNAQRNSLLCNKDGTYKHARELVNVSTERIGRK